MSIVRKTIEHPTMYPNAREIHGEIDEVDFYLLDLKSKFEKIDPTKYALSYSGGRDSHFLYWFIKEFLRDDKIITISVNTRMMLPEIFRRVKKNADVILLPEKSPQEIKEDHGIPCYSKIQDELIDRYQYGLRTEAMMARINGDVPYYSLNKKASRILKAGEMHKVSPKCCTYLKKKPLKKWQKDNGRDAIIGVRAAEGLLRRSVYKSCFHNNGNFTPIHDLSDELLRAIEEKYSIEIPEVYKYTDRTGCTGCPYGRKKQTEWALGYVSENRRNFLIGYFRESYDIKGYKYDETAKYTDVVEEEIDLEIEEKK